MLTSCFISLRTTSCTKYGGLGIQTLCEMSVTDTISGRLELAVADDVYIKNGRNIGVQAFKVGRLTILISIIRRV